MFRRSSTSTASGGTPPPGYKVAMPDRGKPELLGKVVGMGRFPCTPDFAKAAACGVVTLATQTPFAEKKDLLPDSLLLIAGGAPGQG